MGKGSVDRVGAWAYLLRVHAAVVPKLEREVSARGVPLSWYDVLLELNAAPGRRLRMADLGGRVVLSRERVSRVVDDLERAGLVRRERDEEDRRAIFAVLTADGRATLRRVAPTYLQAIHAHFADHLTDAEVTTLVTALGRVLAAEEATTRT